MVDQQLRQSLRMTLYGAGLVLFLCVISFGLSRFRHFDPMRPYGAGAVAVHRISDAPVDGLPQQGQAQANADVQATAGVSSAQDVLLLPASTEYAASQESIRQLEVARQRLEFVTEQIDQRLIKSQVASEVELKSISRQVRELSVEQQQLRDQIAAQQQGLERALYASRESLEQRVDSLASGMQTLQAEVAGRLGSNSPRLAVDPLRQRPSSFDGPANGDDGIAEPADSPKAPLPPEAKSESEPRKDSASMEFEAAPVGPLFSATGLTVGNAVAIYSPLTNSRIPTLRFVSNGRVVVATTDQDGSIVFEEDHSVARSAPMGSKTTANDAFEPPIAAQSVTIVKRAQSAGTAEPRRLSNPGYGISQPSARPNQSVASITSGASSASLPPDRMPLPQTLRPALPQPASVDSSTAKTRISRPPGILAVTQISREPLLLSCQAQGQPLTVILQAVAKASSRHLVLEGVRDVLIGNVQLENAPVETVLARLAEESGLTIEMTQRNITVRERRGASLAGTRRSELPSGSSDGPALTSLSTTRAKNTQAAVALQESSSASTDTKAVVPPVSRLPEPALFPQSKALMATRVTPQQTELSDSAQAIPAADRYELQISVVHVTASRPEIIEKAGLRELKRGDSSDARLSIAGLSTQHNQSTREFLDRSGEAGELEVVHSATMSCRPGDAIRIPIGFACLHCNGETGFLNGNYIVLKAEPNASGTRFLTYGETADRKSRLHSLRSAEALIRTGSSLLIAEAAQSGMISDPDESAAEARKNIADSAVRQRWVQRLVVVTELTHPRLAAVPEFQDQPATPQLNPNVIELPQAPPPEEPSSISTSKSVTLNPPPLPRRIVPADSSSESANVIVPVASAPVTTDSRNVPEDSTAPTSPTSRPASAALQATPIGAPVPQSAAPQLLPQPETMRPAASLIQNPRSVMKVPPAPVTRAAPEVGKDESAEFVIGDRSASSALSEGEAAPRMPAQARRRVPATETSAAAQSGIVERRHSSDALPDLESLLKTRRSR